MLGPVIHAQSDLLKHAVQPDGLTRDDLLVWYRRVRDQSRRLFEIALPDAYYTRPIALRNPIVFYEGHIPAFAVNTLIKLALKRPGLNEAFEVLFARGIDPESDDAAGSTATWPSRRDVQAYRDTAESLIERAIASEPFDDPLGTEAALSIIEHELMHQETLLYLFHNMPYEQKVKQHFRVALRNERTTNDFVSVPAGTATLGADRSHIGFGWDNEFPQHRVDVHAFRIQRHNVTNREYLEYMNATGAAAPHFWTRKDGRSYWRGMFELIPLPDSWPVYVTHDEADAYARWSGARLPTEAEYHRAAFGTPSGEERLYPWGNDLPDRKRGKFDRSSWEPVPVGSYPNSASAWGIHDLVGNGWEWTSTKFAGFAGFEPMPSYPAYSADFFDGKHYVLKGASPATPRELIRSSFRNWFRPNYPYVYATFRCVR